MPASRARVDRRRVRADLREAGPRTECGRAGDVLGPVERALRLQALAQAAAAPVHRGPERRHGTGQNAGAVDVAAAARSFKVESHNHPSAVEPFQGAATWRRRDPARRVRDGRTTDRRARLAALRWPDSERSRYLLDCAVAGSATTATRIGVPTVGGEVYFEPGLRAESGLVNAMCVGLRRARRLIRSAAARRGQRAGAVGRRRAVTGSAGRSVLASRGARRGATRTSARRCRSATRSRRTGCSSARLELLEADCSSRCRTSARPG